MAEEQAFIVAMRERTADASEGVYTEHDQQNRLGHERREGVNDRGRQRKSKIEGTKTEARDRGPREGTKRQEQEKG